MRRRRLLLGIGLLLLGWTGFGRAETPPRLKCTWEERDGRVEAFSPDGRSLISSGADGCHLRDAETGEVRAVLSEARYGLNGPAFSQNGRLLFAKVSSRKYFPVPTHDLKAWEVHTGRLLGVIPYIADGLNAFTEHFALSPDGKLLATLDNSTRLPVVAKSSKAILNGRHEIESWYNASPWMPRIRLWSIPEWKEVAVLEGGSHMVFSPDGMRLATGSRDWKVPVTKLWNVASGALLAELEGKAQWVKPMVFSPDGRFLLVGGAKDETLWEPTTGKKWSVSVEFGRHQAPAFSSDGKLAFPNGVPSGHAFQDVNTVFPCFDVSSPPPRHLKLGQGEPVVQADPRSAPEFVGSLRGMLYAEIPQPGENGRREIVVRSLSNGKVLTRSSVEYLEEAAFSHDGRRLWLKLWRSHGANQSRVMELQSLDAATGRLQSTIPLDRKTWGSCGWKHAPDGRSLAVIYRTGSNVVRAGEEDPSERPLTVEVWDGGGE